MLKKRIYRFIESVLKRIIFFFKKTTNKNLSKAILTAIFKANEEEKILLKINKKESFVVHSHETISKQIFIDGSFDFIDFEKTISIIKELNSLNTLVDIGANIGSICIPALTRNYFKNAIIIEPEIKNFRLLMANVYLNELEKRVIAYNIALTNRDGDILYLKKDDKWDNRGDFRIVENALNDNQSTNKNIAKVKGETLDKIAPDLKKENSLIWMDVQGYEGVVLKGANGCIKKKIPIVLEFSPDLMKNYDSFNNLKLLLPHYSILYNLKEKKPYPIKLTEAKLNELFNNLDYTNLLFI